jgi:hypothetical protein
LKKNTIEGITLPPFTKEFFSDKLLNLVIDHAGGKNNQNYRMDKIAYKHLLENVFLSKTESI